MADKPLNLVLRDLHTIPQRLDEFEWEELRPGVAISRLLKDEQGETRLALLHYEPGATVPSHRHAGMEVIQVLAGAQRDEGGEYSVGSVLVSMPGSSHSIASEEGCVVLASWEKPVQFL